MPDPIRITGFEQSPLGSMGMASIFDFFRQVPEADIPSGFEVKGLPLGRGEFSTGFTQVPAGRPPIAHISPVNGMPLSSSLVAQARNLENYMQMTPAGINDYFTMVRDRGPDISSRLMARDALEMMGNARQFSQNFQLEALNNANDIRLRPNGYQNEQWFSDVRKFADILKRVPGLLSILPDAFDFLNLIGANRSFTQREGSGPNPLQLYLESQGQPSSMRTVLDQYPEAYVSLGGM